MWDLISVSSETGMPLDLTLQMVCATMMHTELRRNGIGCVARSRRYLIIFSVPLVCAIHRMPMKSACIAAHLRLPDVACDKIQPIELKQHIVDRYVRNGRSPPIYPKYRPLRGGADPYTACTARQGGERYWRALQKPLDDEHDCKWRYGLRVGPGHPR